MASSDLFSSIYVVGGAGYIGQRLLPELQKHYPWAEVWCVDLQQPKRWQRYQIANAMEWEPQDQNCVIYWLASIQEPSGGMSKIAADEIMVAAPGYLRFNNRCKHLVYFSSIRAVEAQRSKVTLYSECKLKGELDLQNSSEQGATYTILRPGTVFGGFDDALPVRTTTVPNRYLLTLKLPDNNYIAYICPMELIIERAVVAADYNLMGNRNVAENVGYGWRFTRHTLPRLYELYASPDLKVEPCADTNNTIRENCL